MKAALVLILLTLPASMALAEPLTGKAAKKLLYPAKTGAVVEMLAGSGLSAEDQTVLATVAAQQPWFGAIAISPDEGMMSEATVAAANYHDVAAAGAAAITDCNAKKKGQADCVVATLIRPEGYEPRALSLSLDATAGFRADYPGKGGAMAISAGTGAWGIAEGAEAALAACAAKGGATDCAVVIAD
ncbi:MAG: 5-aminolevulic acid synthase [Paracoccaceae bacterium]